MPSPMVKRPPPPLLGSCNLPFFQRPLLQDRAGPSPMLGDSLQALPGSSLTRVSLAPESSQVLELRKRINLLETRLLGVGTEWWQFLISGLL